MPTTTLPELQASSELETENDADVSSEDAPAVWNNCRPVLSTPWDDIAAMLLRFVETTADNV